MNEFFFNAHDEVVMKLLHYFITEKGYNPIILHGAEDEIWLENMQDSSYEIVRIVSNYIHNNEQLNFDLYRAKQIMKRIKKKTFSWHLNTLSLYINLGDSVEYKKYEHTSYIDCAKISTINDLNSYDFIKEEFPDITKNMDFKEEGFPLFMKITGDITKKNAEISRQAEDVFTKKTPYVTFFIIILNILIFISMYILGRGSTDEATLVFFGASVPSLILNGEYYRLFTAAFLHIGIIHLLCNMYCLYVIGPQIESFFGKVKFIFIYLFSILTSSLLSVAIHSSSGNVISAGASGAIFGLLGSLLYFGYHYRVYLGSTLKSQIIPLIVLNLIIGFTISGIDNAAHIGGLIGGILASMAVGVKYKSTTFEKVNGWIISGIFIAFLIFMAFHGV